MLGCFLPKYKVSLVSKTCDHVGGQVGRSLLCQGDRQLTGFVEAKVSADVQVDHLLVEHVHQSSGGGDENVNPTPDDFEGFGAGDPADGQAGLDRAVALGLQVGREVLDVFVNLKFFKSRSQCHEKI